MSGIKGQKWIKKEKKTNREYYTTHQEHYHPDRALEDKYIQTTPTSSLSRIYDAYSENKRSQEWD